jgi:hypothetical protein
VIRYLKVFPASNGFGEKTLESLARGVDPGIRPNPNALSMNLGEIAQEIHQYIPAITDLIKLGSAAFVAWKAGTAAAPPTAPDIASEVLRRLSEQKAGGVTGEHFEPDPATVSRAADYVIERQAKHHVK